MVTRRSRNKGQRKKTKERAERQKERDETDRFADDKEAGHWVRKFYAPPQEEPMTVMETALRAALVAALETERVHGVREAAHQWELTGWSVEYCRTWWEAGYWHPGDALDAQKMRTATQDHS